MDAVEQFDDGLHLLLDAEESDRPAIEMRLRQDFWSLSGADIGAGAGCIAKFATNLRPTPDLHAVRLILFDLVLQATSGDIVWQIIQNSLAYADCRVLLTLLQQYPARFSWKCLRDIQARLANKAALDASQLSLDIMAPGPISAANARLVHEGYRKKVLELVYDLRIKNYVQRSGPALGANFEAEQAALEESIAEAGISDGVLPALKKAHEYLSGHQEDFSFKTSMDLTRTAYEETINSCAKKAEVKPAMTGGQTLTLLKNEGKLTEEEWDLARGLYKFLSERGSHTLNSEHKEAKVSLFMVMEFSQYLIGTLVPSKKEQS